MIRAPFPTEADIRDWCIDYLAGTMEIPAADIDVDVKFSRLGMDSASSAHFILELEQWLGIELDLEVTGSHPTIAKLANYIRARYLAGDTA